MCTGGLWFCLRVCGQDDERRSERSHRPATEPEHFGEEEDEGEYSDADDFIVDDDGKPIARKKKKPIFSDAALQEAQETFGVDFDYDEFSKYDDDYDDDEEEDEEDEYEEGTSLKHVVYN